MSVLRSTVSVVRGVVAAATLVFAVGGVGALTDPANPGSKIRARGTQTVEAMDVTVTLFTTARLQAVELSGSGARWRLCASCAPQPMGSPLALSLAPGGKQVSVAGKTVAGVFVEGDVSARASDGRVAQVPGRWSVRAAAGGLHVTVNVPSERYVMAVLQAEAAADEPLESLKALAVAARSFAMQNSRRHGADGLCDSTHCQALRFGAVPERVREAVDATAGETLWLGSSLQQVSGYFTQDCGGMTEDAATLWGGKPRPWLGVHADPFCVRDPALWHAELSVAQVRDALAGEGVAVPAAVTGLKVAKKDASGRVAVVEVLGKAGLSGAKAPLSGQSATDGLKPVPFKAPAASQASAVATASLSAATLRFALNRAFGWNELRSDWYRVSVVNGRVVFDGRGFGHGVGLCQAGARAMAAQGKRYREILGFYFPGTTVRVLAGDNGWATRRANGWTLRAVNSGNEWVQAGDAAWAQARAVFPMARTLPPVVTVYPTTELFRQATGEAGWNLAAARGVRVGLQPLLVVQRASCGPGSQRRSLEQPCLQRLMEHEFLHVLVEGEASARAPLWLREGLVEALAGERCTAVGMPVSQTEAALAKAGSRHESYRAHAAACVRVQQAIAKYGPAPVRGWLRDGVPASVLSGQ